MTYEQWKRNRHELNRKKKIGSIIDWFITHCRDTEPEQHEDHAATRYIMMEQEPEGHLPIWEQLALVVGLIFVALFFLVWVIVLYFAQTPGSHP